VSGTSGKQREDELMGRWIKKKAAHEKKTIQKERTDFDEKP